MTEADCCATTMAPLSGIERKQGRKEGKIPRRRRREIDRNIPTNMVQKTFYFPPPVLALMGNECFSQSVGVRTKGH